MIDTEHTGAPVCPHCGLILREWWKLGLHGDGDATEVECGKCWGSYTVILYQETTFTTEAKNEWADMHKITAKIWLGDEQAARNYTQLKKHGITVTFNVAKQLDSNTFYGPDILRCNYGLIDGVGNEQESFNRATRELIKLLKNTEHVILVHCLAGVSRSPTIVATALAKILGHSFQYALDFVGEKRPIIDPNKALIKLAKTYLGEI